LLKTHQLRSGKSVLSLPSWRSANPLMTSRLVNETRFRAMCPLFWLARSQTTRSLHTKPIRHSKGYKILFQTMVGLAFSFSTEIGEKRGNVRFLTFTAQFLGTAWEYFNRIKTLKISIHSPFDWYTLGNKVKCVAHAKWENRRPV